MSVKHGVGPGIQFKKIPPTTILNVKVNPRKLALLIIILLAYGCIRGLEKLSADWRDKAFQTYSEQSQLFREQEICDENAQCFINLTM